MNIDAYIFDSILTAIEWDIVDDSLGNFISVYAHHLAGQSSEAVN